MTPIFQDKFFKPGVGADGQRGNCFSACIASLLDLPLKAVPNFVEIDVLGGPNWWWLADKYLGLLGYTIVEVSPRNPPSGYYMMGGISPRSTDDCVVHHAVIGKDGEIVHDPMPGGEGLLTVQTARYLDKTGFRY